MKLIKEPEQSTRVCSAVSIAAVPPAMGTFTGSPQTAAEKKVWGPLRGALRGRGGGRWWRCGKRERMLAVRTWKAPGAAVTDEWYGGRGMRLMWRGVIQKLCLWKNQGRNAELGSTEG